MATTRPTDRPPTRPPLSRDFSDLLRVLGSDADDVINQGKELGYQGLQLMAYVADVRAHLTAEATQDVIANAADDIVRAIDRLTDTIAGK